MKKMILLVTVFGIPSLAVTLLFSLMIIVSPVATNIVRAQDGMVQIGQLRLADNKDSRAGTFSLELKQMAPAPSGKHYELWMQSDEGELLALGKFEVLGSGVVFTGNTELNLLEGYSNVLVSLEPDSDPDVTTLTQIVLSSTLPAELLTLARPLLVGNEAGDPTLFDNLQAQVATTSESNGILADSLGVDDFEEVRRRAEHIVNIIDGETGDFYGDLNRDGQIQNAGDGVGVRVYLEQGHDYMLDILAAVTTTEELRTQTQQIITMFENSQLLAEEVSSEAQKIFAADTKAESEAIMKNIDGYLAELSDLLTNAYSATLELAAYRFYSASATPTAEVHHKAVRIGQLRLVDNETVSTGGFNLELEKMAPAPAGRHYELWMRSESGTLLRLGEFAVDAGRATFAGSTEESLLANYNTVLISSESDDGPIAATPTQVILSSTLPIELLNPVRQLLTSQATDSPAPMPNMQVQTAIASEHSNLLVDSLMLEDMTEVDRHSEHIINILDGETGEFYGDINRDGQTQNPGDGLGVRVYLERAHNLTLAILSLLTGDEERSTQAQQLMSKLEESQLLQQKARDYALDTFGTTTELELLAVAKDIVKTMTLLTDSEHQAHLATLAMVTFEFFAPPATSTTISTAITRSVVNTTPPLTATVGETWTQLVEQAVYVYVPEGEVTLGADTDDRMRATENPQHTVENGAFWIRQTEVTNAQYGQCVALGVCTSPSNDLWNKAESANHPVTDVSWEQANAYAKWAGGRLPSEAEWEKACHGANDQIYPWGDENPTSELANYFDFVGSTTPVGSYPDGASPEGLLDMSGNVWEWTNSLDKLYPYDAQDGREKPDEVGNRISRGGSFNYPLDFLHCSTRVGFNIASQLPQLGFRVAISATK